MPLPQNGFYSVHYHSTSRGAQKAENVADTPGLTRATETQVLVIYNLLEQGGLRADLREGMADRQCWA